jgi:hypothetical protein
MPTGFFPPGYKSPNYPGATTASTGSNTVVANTGIAKNLSVSGDLKNLVNEGGTAVAAFGKSALANAGIPNPSSANISNLADIGKLSDYSSSEKTIVPINETPPFPNILGLYTTVNYIFTLSVLTDDEINFPDENYRKGVIKPNTIILKSGSGTPDNRIPTAIATQNNPSGKFDFFMDDLRLEGAMGFDKATGNTNTTSLSFTVTEPYSMGLFMQAIQVAAKNAGHQNYLTAPFLLKIEFTGHIDGETTGVNIPGTTRYIPLKLREVEMAVDQRGAKYDVQAYPWNEQGFADSYAMLMTDVNISGATVQEMLQSGPKSLQKQINDRIRETTNKDTQAQISVPDEVIILFPTDLKTSNSGSSQSVNSATTNASQVSQNNTIETKLGVTKGGAAAYYTQSAVNKIGSSNMAFDSLRSPDKEFAKDNATYNESSGYYNRSSVNSASNTSDFRFKQGTNVVNIINQVILQSDYARQATSNNQITAEGMVPWWRIETQVYNKSTDANIGLTGEKPKIIVYRVVPYLVNSSRLLAPNTPPPGVEKLKKQAIKEFNYIFTGKNLDVLSFNINFNAAFYQSYTADSGISNQDIKKQTEESGTVDETVERGQNSVGNSTISDNSIGTQRRYDRINTSTDNAGGGGIETLETRIARQFHDILIEGADMINVEMAIIGDPYFLGDSGMGNYTAPETSLININADGTIDYQSGEVDIILNFRTPVDLNENTGFYEFGPDKLVAEYSGLYKVQTINSIFSRGKFSQELSMTRRMVQENADQAPAKPTLAVASDSVPTWEQTQANFLAAITRTNQTGSKNVIDNKGTVTEVSPPVRTPFTI